MKALLALVAVAACGSNDAAPADAMPDAFGVAAHTAYPQLPDLGGPRLAHPQIVTVTFANDPRAATFEAFASWIVTSDWLAAVGAEYGVGPGAVAGVAHRPETPMPMITSAEIEAYLAAGVMDGSIPRPANLADALYIVYYPSTTQITTTFVNGIVKKSCSSFGGYHGEVHANGQNFAYSAIPDCGGSITGLTAIETIEMIVSHEVIEASTDAAPISAPAYQLRPDPTDAWYTAFEFEVEDGDLCEAPERFVREATFVAQRSWSNAAAAAGKEPCVPADPTSPAFGATVSPIGTQHAAAGATVDFAVTGWSSGPVADWRLTTQARSLLIHVKLDKASLNNGDTTMLHVTVPANAVSGSTVPIFLIASHTAVDATMWPIAIVVD